jgi:hypothetical protein
MASMCFQEKANNFPSAPLPDYGGHPSRLLAPEGVCSLEYGEIFDSEDGDDDLPSLKKILARPTRAQPPTRPPVIGLTCDSADDETEVSRHRKTPRRLGIT